jgi:RNA polymerase sigma-70 factor (ECF subfamily)
LKSILTGLKISASYHYTRLSDDELVKLFKEQKETEIIGVLYKRYMYLVYGVCMKYLKNREDSQDAVMQIFETVVHDVSRFEVRIFKSWLYGVSRNHCLMRLRKNNTEKNRFEKISAALFMESTATLHPIEEEDNEALQNKLKGCLDALKTEQRQCVEMFYYQEKCYKEIANDLSFDEQKVKSFIQNGKRNLKICLESKSMTENVQN